MTDQNNEGWPAVLRLNDHYMEEIVGWMQADDRVSGGMTYIRAYRAAPEGQVREVDRVHLEYAAKLAGKNGDDEGREALLRILAAITPPPAAPTDNTALVEALTPFADISREGVVTVKEGHVNIVTCAEYFHRAAAALASREAPPAAQEPVAWLIEANGEGVSIFTRDSSLAGARRSSPDFTVTPLYAAPPPACQQEAVLLEIIEWCHNQIGNYPDWFDRARKAVGQFDGDAGDPAPRIAEVAALGLALIEQDELGGKAGWDAFANALRTLGDGDA
jgi:hypothetical protein